MKCVNSPAMDRARINTKKAPLPRPHTVLSDRLTRSTSMKTLNSRLLYLRGTVALFAAIACASSTRADASKGPSSPAPLFEDIGRHHHPISTRSAQAQRYFDQGMMLVFNFNHKEAIRSFRAAASLDPECAMAAWGEAYAYGPHINGPMTDDAVPLAWDALQRAQRLLPNANPRERAYLGALATRYVAPGVKQDRAELDRAFAHAMRGVAQKFPDDHDAVVLWVDAWMNTTPWDYWQADKRTPKPETAEAMAAIEQVLARVADHPAANHLLIHLAEAGPQPGHALPSAGRLRRYAPAAGHLVHMPSHIYIRVGQYQDAVDANE